LTPPLGIVTEQSFPDEDVQADDQVTLVPELGSAVSPTEAPTGKAEMHVVGQSIGGLPVKLITVPSPATCTLKKVSVPPPGQVKMAGLLTVTVA